MYQCRKCGFAARFRMTPKKCPKCEAGNSRLPLWVRLLQRLSKPQDIGLGATVKRIAAKVGGERFKVWAKRVRLPCGCTEREAELNKLYPNPHYRQP